MHIRRNNLIILLITFLICQQICSGQEKASQPSNKTDTQQLSEEQLKINRDALLENKSEQIRIQAATLILADESEAARKIILETLKKEKNAPARMAVCKALSKTRTEKKTIKNKDDFVIPLLSILITSNDTAEVKLAAEALLIFDYSQIADKIELVAKAPSSPINARLNAIYALRLQPDMRATIELIKLVDDPDTQVSASASKALQSLGIFVGEEAEIREKIIEELESKGEEKFLRERLIQQELNKDKLEEKIDFWRERYLALLDNNYNSITEDTSRGRFLSELLNERESAVRLWALDKVDKWRAGPGPKPNMLTEVGHSLIKLISDENEEVRLKTAKLLPLIGELDTAGPLAEQFKTETNQDVKSELLAALGWACYYSFLQNASIKIPPELKKQTLKWAEEYLADADSNKARVGAEVIRKLLEHDGLSEGEVSRYLGLLAKRYTEQKKEQADELCSELLVAMARLCGQSVYKEKAAEIFRPLFEEALQSKTDSLREASVDGLIYINKSSALQRLRRDFIKDQNPGIRKKIIELAESVGGKDDLVWLSEKIGTNAESNSAWQAMLKIFKRSDVETLEKWLVRLDAKLKEGKLSEEQMLSLLETAEGKVAAEKKTKMLRDIELKMARLYKKNGDYERAAKYYGAVLNINSGQDKREKESILAELLEVYLRWPKIEQAKELINNRLLEEDLSADSQLINTIDFYFGNPPAGNDPNSLVESLSQLQIPEKRPKWTEQIQKWSAQFNKPQDTVRD